jgi:S-DNA-T family DNA segregation ATPase FtsK/SpoIIIE
MYTKRPDELKLILVDPKMVELSQFADIPHLACPVVTEMGRAAAILEWAVDRMEERYKLFQKLGVRDLVGFNELTEDEIYNILEPENEEARARIPIKLPYIVFIIDELADLMMTSNVVEHLIVRIAQKARAIGIHLILSTQRPEAKVVTGLIKSNMPCRVAFKVSSGMDSRIVLDCKGAELLLGNGDMLYISPSSTQAFRAQGTFVSPKEIRLIVKHLKEVAAPNFERSLVQIKPSSSGGTSDNGEFLERDDLFDSAVRVMIESGRGSVSLLQRRMGIGYGRASRLVDQMATAGILGEHKGSVAREILISLEDWDEMQEMEEEL